MDYNRNKVLEVMQDWIGYRESNGTYREIINEYNKITPLPEGYKLKYTDSWCAAAVSAAYHKAGYDDIFPSECSCGRIITKSKKMGIWVENDAHVPSPGDCIIYDWGDSGVGDNVGSPDHIGMVESVNKGLIIVIEGNMDNSVGRRTIPINGKYIRGFITPKFSGKVEKSEKTEKSSAKVSVINVSKNEIAKYFSRDLAGDYLVSYSPVHLRTGAGVTSKSILTMKKGTKVKNYGYYNNSFGVKWLYVQVMVDGIEYTGYCSSIYLSKG